MNGPQVATRKFKYGQRWRNTATNEVTMIASIDCATKVLGITESGGGGMPISISYFLKWYIPVDQEERE